MLGTKVIIASIVPPGEEDIIMGKSTGDGPFTTQEYREIAQILEAKDFDNLFSNESGEIH